MCVYRPEEFYECEAPRGGKSNVTVDNESVEIGCSKASVRDKGPTHRHSL